MRSIVARFGFVVLIGVALTGAALLMAGGVGEPIAVAAMSLMGAIVIGVGERVLPHSESWKQDHGDTRHDLFHMTLSMVLAPEAIKLAAIGALTGLSVWLTEAVGSPLWPDWPLWASLPLALVVAEFGGYWAHRWDARESVALVAPRAAPFGPSALLAERRSVPRARRRRSPTSPRCPCSSSWDAPADVIALVLVFTAIHGMYQHANLPVKIGPLNWVFSMTELHRWHHSRDISESNSNYGANLIIWDIVFGTRRLPGARAPTGERRRCARERGVPGYVGGADDVPVPGSSATLGRPCGRRWTGAGQPRRIIAC